MTSIIIDKNLLTKCKVMFSNSEIFTLLQSISLGDGAGVTLTNFPRKHIS